MRKRKREMGKVLNASTDPVLAELWDNDDDAIYDDIPSWPSKPATEKPTGGPSGSDKGSGQGRPHEAV